MILTVLHASNQPTHGGWDIMHTISWYPRNKHAFQFWKQINITIMVDVLSGLEWSPRENARVGG